MTLTHRATRSKTEAARSLIGRVVNIRIENWCWMKENSIGTEETFKKYGWLYDFPNKGQGPTEDNWTIVSLKSWKSSGVWCFVLEKHIGCDNCGMVELPVDDYYLKENFPSPPEEGIEIKKDGTIQFGLNFYRNSNIIQEHDLRYWMLHLKTMTSLYKNRYIETEAPDFKDNIAAKNITTIARCRYYKAHEAYKQEKKKIQMERIIDELKNKYGSTTIKISFHYLFNEDEKTKYALRIKEAAEKKMLTHPRTRIKRGTRVRPFTKKLGGINEN